MVSVKYDRLSTPILHWDGSMQCRMLRVGVLAVTTSIDLTVSVMAQDRGSGYSYDSGPNYFAPSPAYDPFRNEQYGRPDYRHAPRPAVGDYAENRGGTTPKARRAIRVSKTIVAKARKSSRQSTLKPWLSD